MWEGRDRRACMPCEIKPNFKEQSIPASLLRLPFCGSQELGGSCLAVNHPRTTAPTQPPVLQALGEKKPSTVMNPTALHLLILEYQLSFKFISSTLAVGLVHIDVVLPSNTAWAQPRGCPCVGLSPRGRSTLGGREG